jgi:sugar phosphate isomerase/epimerase
VKKQRLSHLTYCTNVHPLQNYTVWREKIGYFGTALAAQQGQSPFPLGLWFNDRVLADAHPGVIETGEAPESLQNLKRDLQSWGASTFTFNAFPFGDFHEPVVKRKVYLPDWTDPARLDYTQRCAEVLAALLPDDHDFGSISTLPLGWRVDWTSEHSQASAEALVDLALFLAELERRTGKTIGLAIEPEPGCVLERTPQVLAFWKDFLRPTAAVRDAANAGSGGAQAAVTHAVERHIGLCYDTCHQAVQFEDAEESLAALSRAGIKIHKMQLSSALEFPPDLEQRSRPAREAFVEPKFLHQTRVQTPEGIFDIDDLPQALNAGPGLFAYPWRVHYHVPVHADSLLGDGGENAAVRTTRDEMLKALRYALEHDLCTHFEVETYTWSVLPEEHRPADDAALARSLGKELDFIRAAVPGVFDKMKAER